MGFWDGLKRFFCGYPKAKSLDDLCRIVKNPQELADYAKQHFIYKKRASDVTNWLPPEKAFALLHAKDSILINDSIDCDDCASVEWYVLNHLGYAARLIGVFGSNSNIGHAICIYPYKGQYRYVDSHYHPQWSFKTVMDVLRDVYSNPTRAWYMDWDGKKFVKGSTII